MNRKQVLGIAALSLLSAVACAQTVSPEQWVGTPDAGPVAVSRTTVVAERNLWIRAGLVDTGDDAYMDPTYGRRLAHYTRMRHGPEFVAEMRRIESRPSRTTAMNTVVGR